MSVSGHKSIQSLAIYQKTKDKQKIQMQKALFDSMTKSKDDINVNRNQLDRIKALLWLQKVNLQLHLQHQ